MNVEYACTNVFQREASGFSPVAASLSFSPTPPPSPEPLFSSSSSSFFFLSSWCFFYRHKSLWYWHKVHKELFLSMYWQLRLSHCWRRPCEDMTACGPLDCCSSCSSHLSALFAEPGVGRAQAKRPEANSGSGRTCACVSSLPADAADGLHSALWWLTPRTQPWRSGNRCLLQSGACTCAPHTTETMPAFVRRVRSATNALYKELGRGRNLDVHRQTNGWESCGTYTQWNVTQPFERMHLNRF